VLFLIPQYTIVASSYQLSNTSYKKLDDAKTKNNQQVNNTILTKQKNMMKSQKSTRKKIRFKVLDSSPIS
jgi:hypothetical protein